MAASPTTRDRNPCLNYRSYNERALGKGDDNTDVNWGSNPPSSNHTGGVNVLYADGSVSFVSDSIDQWVWTNMGTRSGDL